MSSATAMAAQEVKLLLARVAELEKFNKALNEHGEMIMRKLDALEIKHEERLDVVTDTACKLGEALAQLELYGKALKEVQGRGWRDDDESSIDALIGCIEIADEALAL